MVADTKKCQSRINVVADQAQAIRDAVTALKDIKTKFETHNPAVVGTALDGKVGALNDSLAAIDTEISKAVWTDLIAATVPSHRNKALD